MNDAGAITDTYNSDAFGKVISSTGSTPNEFLAVLAALLALAVLGGIWEIAPHLLGWFWFAPLALLVLAGWVAPALYGDHLVRQGQYDQALRLVPVLAVSRAGRNRRRVEVLVEAGRYEEAERILRDIFDRMAGTKVRNVARIKTCLDLENFGNVLMEMGRFEEAQRCFRSAARIYAHHSGWATGLAEVLLRQGTFPQAALAHVERALGLFQRGWERVGSSCQPGAILGTKAWALAACGRGAEAQVAIDAALGGPARKTKGPLAQIHFKAGMSFLALSDPQRAEQHFARGAELDPTGRWGRLCADALRRQGPAIPGPPTEG